MIENQTLTYADFKAKKKRREITHLVATDDDAVKSFRLATVNLQNAQRGTNKNAIAQAQAALDEAKAALDPTVLAFRLRALPRKGDGSYDALRAQHPTTTELNEKLRAESGDPKAKMAYNPDTFGPALVAASLIEPAVTVEEATEMAVDLNDAEWDDLFSAAILVNQQATNTVGLDLH